jgi:ABC-type Fe3+/spermidine/putrescine transport system ATPase subunit
LARALAIEPRVLLLDEPLSALDAVVRVVLREEIRRIQSTFGITTLYVTHDQEEALAISDRVVVMRDGWVEQVGTPEAVYADPGTRFVATFIGKMNQLPGVVERAREGRVRWGDHRLAVPPASTARLAEGQAVVVLIRPETVAVDAADAEGPMEQAGENRIPATVDLVTFLGPVTRLSLEAGGRRFLADVTTGDRGRFQRGVSVQLVFPAAACRVLAEESAEGSQ